jgi:group I intron endonuclease
LKLLKTHPFLSLVNSYVIDSPSPSNISYLWNYGSLLGVVLIIQIVTGVTLAMHYTPHIDLAFISVEHIMRDINYGWMIRYLHANGAAFFFIFIYIHMAKGLYYGEIKNIKNKYYYSNSINVIIFLLLIIITGFLSYSQYIVCEQIGIYLSNEIHSSYNIFFSTYEYPYSMFILVPVTIYHNAETDKSKIISDNKDKAGIYMWKHIETNTIYIGSAVDLSKRLSNYYASSYLKRTKNYICNALLFHGHSAFSIPILEYIDITGLSKEEARKLILEREQYYLDLIFLDDEPNTYNILKEAGSSLGYIHLAETKAAISEALKGENSTNFGKTGEEHPMYGKSHSAETLVKMSKAPGSARCTPLRGELKRVRIIQCLV